MKYIRIYYNSMRELFPTRLPAMALAPTSVIAKETTLLFDEIIESINQIIHQENKYT